MNFCTCSGCNSILNVSNQGYLFCQNCDKTIRQKDLPKSRVRKDLGTGLIWIFIQDLELTHQEALKFAEDKGLRLPTVDEFREAIDYSYVKFEPRWYWSSSLHNAGSAWEFNGTSGGVGYFYHYYGGSSVVLIKD